MNLTYIISRLLRAAFYALLFLMIVLVGIGIYVSQVLIPQLPSTIDIKEIHLQVPLKVYSHDGHSIAEFGEERRIPMYSDQVPAMLIHAILTAEDNRFYVHSGVDFKGLVRASVNLIKTGSKAQGASTITMQLARNIFPKKLGKDKNFTRKFKEILVAFQIEQELSKDEILTLYLNKIFLGHRAYGMAAAAQVYYGRNIQDLTVAEYAMLAGLPKAPSAFNPITNPKRALIRRNYILKRMLELKHIDNETYTRSIKMPITAARRAFRAEYYAPYMAEMVRHFMLKNYTKPYSNGYRVYTTLHPELQTAARNAVQRQVMVYDTRHGYRGALAHFDLDALAQETDDNDQARRNLLDKKLKKYPSHGFLIPAFTLSITDKTAKVYNPKHGIIEISWRGLAWARPYKSPTHKGAAPKQAADVIKAGDVVMIMPFLHKDKKTKKAKKTATDNDKPAWRLAQIPAVSAALVSLDPQNGAILALMGGFSFSLSKFNRITQAIRQPGSNFKPFIYSAALENGYTPASMINDSPLVFGSGKKTWIPENYEEKFGGPISMRTALAKSRNLISIRLMRSMGIEKTLQYVSRFGFEPEKLPHNMTLSLGTADLHPIQITTGFATFANGGFKIDPYFIERIEDSKGNIIFQANPATVCKTCPQPELNPLLDELSQMVTVDKKNPHKLSTAEKEAKLALQLALLEEQGETEFQGKVAPRVISAENAYLITSMLGSVVKRGTARAALKMKRKDIAGKTGTTNDMFDAWFSGFNPDIVTSVWMGFDSPHTLGKVGGMRETGSSAALPMWIDYMSHALKDKPIREWQQPVGIIAKRIDPKSGLLATKQQDDTVWEFFQKDTVPRQLGAERSQGNSINEDDMADLF